jgi:ubiquinol-cytochrome c reductase cytochrome c1 subunit
MLKSVLAAVAALALALPAAAEDEFPKQDWTFNGVFGQFDKEQIQRGFQVYKEVCSNCHSLHYIAFRHLEALGYSEDQIKSLAATYQVDDGPDENGDMFKRKGKPSDLIPPPFPNDNAARVSNGGALPPDLSLIVKAREGGPDYVYNLLLGYRDAPADMKMAPGMNYNIYFSKGANQIAMPQQVKDGIVTFADGSPNDAAHIAKDVTAFLMWTAEPKMEIRHSIGFRVFLYTLFFTVLAYALKRRIWARLGDH